LFDICEISSQRSVSLGQLWDSVFTYFSNCTVSFNSFLLMYHRFFPIHVICLLNLLSISLCLFNIIGKRISVLSCYWARSRSRKERLFASSHTYVRAAIRLSACINPDPTGRISVQLDMGGILGKYVEKVRRWLQSGTSYDKISTFIVIGDI
jgi:hypothetical protein